MSWADKRRALVITIIVAVIGTVLALALTSALYKAPTCTDGVQNQGEAGVDCGGPCPYLCIAQVKQPVARFVLPLANTGTRTDVIAYVDNPNTDAAIKDAPYTIDLYDASNNKIASKTGTVSLPPHSTVPIYIPNFYNGAQKATNGFLTFNTSAMHWYKTTKTPVTLPISNINVTNSSTSPRVTATINNPEVDALYNVKVVVAVYDTAGNVMAASQTVVPRIPQLGSAHMIFTWNTPFTGTPAREEIWPLLPLAGP